MPKQKDLKRRVRARMEKTGESYTAARARVVARRAAPAQPAQPTQPDSDLATRAGLSDARVEAATGRGWSDWVRVLDAAGAASWPHRDIARHLAAEHGVPPWWSQMVTVGYERIRGLRAVGQRREGAYDVNKSRTYPVAVDRLYRACRDARTRARWLPEKPAVRTAIENRSIRFTWPDDTRVQFYFTAKGPAKSTLAVQHERLGTRVDADRLRGWWGERLAELADVLG